MSIEKRQYTINDPGYFGVSLLDMGSYGAHLMENRLIESESHGSGLHFDEASAFYSQEKRVLTVEGVANTISSPSFALSSLEAYARIAREMDELAHPFAC